ncbi:MAG TPA: hypothetical protein VFC72_02655 [Corynebacterium sp.]|nr:hypothetical protein [Corynebacterium sp.]
MSTPFTQDTMTLDQVEHERKERERRSQQARNWRIRLVAGILSVVGAIALMTWIFITVWTALPPEVTNPVTSTAPAAPAL